MKIGNIQISNKIVKWIILGIIIILMGFLAYWIITRAYIQVNISGQTSDQFKYSFLNQSNDSLSIIDSNSNKYSQLVSSGNYEVNAFQTSLGSEKSSFNYLKTGNLFSTSQVDAGLVSENARVFIGNNPSGCNNYLFNQLISYICGGLLANAQVYIDATPTQPAYSLTTKGAGPAGYDEGIFNTPEGNFVLSRSPAESEYGSRQILTKLGTGFKSLGGIEMPDLDPTQTYFSKAWQEGFLVSTLNFSTIYYFPSSKSRASKVYGTSPGSQELNPVSLDIYNDQILTSYSIITEDNSRNFTEVYIISNSSTQKFKLNKSYSKVNFCASSKYICALSGDKLDIYKVNGTELLYKHSINKVISILNNHNSFLVVNNIGVLNLEIEQQKGYYSYTLSEYQFQKIEPSSNGYILTLTNNNNRSFALLVDQTLENKGSIDKVVLKLQSDSNISNVAAYKNIVFLTPNIDRQLDKDQNIFVYNQAKLKDINTNINNLLKSLNIPSDYTVVNTTSN